MIPTLFAPFALARTRRLLIALSLSCFILGGCGKSHEKPTAVVRGTVTLDGTPVPGGSVMFVPQEGRGAAGIIDEQGNYVLSTYSDRDGAIIGVHKIVVYPAKGGFEDDALPPNYRPIPTHYQSIGSSGLEREVKVGERNVINLELTTHSP